MNSLLCSLLVTQQAANTTKTVYVPCPGLSGEEYYLENLTFIPDSDGAVSIDGTNNITVTAKQGSTSLGSFTTNTGGTALVAGTAVPFTLSGALRQFSAVTDALVIDLAKNGSGAALKGVFNATWRKLHA